MTLFWIGLVGVMSWNLGRAQLRAEIADREARKARDRRSTDFPARGF